MLCKTGDTMPAQEQLGAWLAIGAGDLAPLFDERWSVEDILAALQTVLQGVKAMHKFSRRQLLQLGAAAMVSSVHIPEGRHISAEDRMQLCSALDENIAGGWRLFTTASMSQVLAVGQAQLFLIQQVHAEIYPNVRPLLSSEKHVSSEERTQLHTALGENISEAWKRFTTASMLQVLVIGQAQLQV